MGKATSSPAIDQARLLLNLFKTLSEAESARHADDVLSYFRKLHDHYQITKSSSPRFLDTHSLGTGTTFIILEEVMYELEARPDKTLLSSDFREFIISVLEDIAGGRIQLASKLKSPGIPKL